MSTKLIVLGILMEGEKHPYEIQQLIRLREMDKYIKFQKGSLYYAVNQLEKDNLIEISGVLSDNKRPEKTIYRITNTGRAAFHEILLEQFASITQFNNPIYEALAFAKMGDPVEIAEVLGDRIKKTESMLKMLESSYEDHSKYISRANLHIMASAIEHTKTELKWIKVFRQDALDNRLGEIGGTISYEVGPASRER